MWSKKGGMEVYRKREEGEGGREVGRREVYRRREEGGGREVGGRRREGEGRRVPLHSP